MHLLFEEDGDLKAGTVRSSAEASFQVDSTTGKRIKVKAAAVLLRFEEPRAEELLARAQAGAAAMDIEFLWQCAPQQEFGFEELAREYCGHAPSAVEAASILVRLQSAPVYFQRKGRGRFRPAAPEVLRAALAAVERRRLQDEQRARMVAELVGGALPPEVAGQGTALLTHPDRNGIVYKAVEQAAHALQTTPLRLLLARGAIASPYAWHNAAFLARAFPRGPRFDADLPAPGAAADDLPLAAVQAFSIDDSATTEIDDAFSVQQETGRLTVGIHIAAPAHGLPPGHPVDQVARARLSTVYAPGLKYTMLPPAWIDAYSLAQGRTVPALSLYLDLDPATLDVRGARTALEAVRVAQNLRYDVMEDQVTEESLQQGTLAVPFAEQLALLWRLATARRALREQARGRPEPRGRDEVALVLEGEGESARVRLAVRRRDSPLDRIVAELMILANSHWGAWLEEGGVVGIYRSQSLGRVRMSTSPAPHEGLGVAQYAWCTSPLRRYVDLLNQRQLIARAAGLPAPHRRGDADVFAVVSAFDAAYAAYAEFQDAMERYWSLRWLQQEAIRRIGGRVARDEIVRIDGLPLTVRLAAAAALERGSRVELEIADVDLVELTAQARILEVLAPDATGASDAAGAEEPGGDAAPGTGGMEPVGTP